MQYPLLQIPINRTTEPPSNHHRTPMGAVYRPMEIANFQNCAWLCKSPIHLNNMGEPQIAELKSSDVGNNWIELLRH